MLFPDEKAWLADRDQRNPHLVRKNDSRRCSVVGLLPVSRVRNLIRQEQRRIWLHQWLIAMERVSVKGKTFRPRPEWRSLIIHGADRPSAIDFMCIVMNPRNWDRTIEAREMGSKWVVIRRVKKFGNQIRFDIKWFPMHMHMRFCAQCPIPMRMWRLPRSL